MKSRFPLQTWVIGRPFAVIDSAVASHLDLSPRGMVEFERIDSASASSIYVLSHSDMGGVGEVHLRSLGAKKTEVAFLSYWGPQLADPIRRNRREHMSVIAQRLLYKLDEDGLLALKESDGVTSEAELSRLEKAILEAVEHSRREGMPTTDDGISARLGEMGVRNPEGNDYSRTYINRKRNELRNKYLDV